MISPCYNSCYAKTWKNLKEWLQLFFFNRKRVSNGWRQLELRINSIPFKYLSNILYIRNHGCKCSFKKTLSIEVSIAATILWNKETLYPEKTYFLRLNAVTFKEIFLGTTTSDRSLSLWAAISLGILYICRE